MSYDVDSSLVNSFKPEVFSELMSIFKEFDTNNNAVMEKSEFKNLLNKLGLGDLDKKQINALFKEFDLNNDKVLSFYEFLLIMKKIKT